MTARRYGIVQSNALSFLAALPDDYCDLVVFSPPYERARTYGIDFAIAGQAWVDWMLKIFAACQRVCKGVVGCVCEGQTKNYRWSAVPALLMADLHRAGFNLRRPIHFHRIGIPGSGGPDWVRGDTEYVICTTRPGKLLWSDNTACGHPPKWAPGGAMSNRLSDGTRVNQWGGHANSSQQRRADGSRQPPGRPSHVIVSGDEDPPTEMFDGVVPDEVPERDAHGFTPHVEPSETQRRNGAKRGVGKFGNVPSSQGRERDGRPKKRLGRNMANGVPGSTKGSCVGRRVVRGSKDGDTVTEDAYLPPVLANPGNVVQQTYTADEVAALLAEAGNVSHHKVGGGLMGHPSAHLNEAPYPLGLPEFFVRSFCPPDGIVCDPFLGSGTTGHAAIKWGRRFVGCDIRADQVEIARKRLEGVTPMILMRGSK